jgi:hypothetical protein
MLERLLGSFKHRVEKIIDPDEYTFTVRVFLNGKQVSEDVTDLVPLFEAQEKWKKTNKEK